MKKRHIKTALNLVLSVVVILLLLVAAGIEYIKYTSDQSGSSAQSASPPEQPVLRPPKVSPKAKESASIETLSSPVKRGSAASINVKTNPNSKCTIEAAYKDSSGSSVIYSNPSLKSKKADDFGLISWTWPVNDSAPAGKWTVTVTCLYNKNSAVVIGDMLVD